MANILQQRDPDPSSAMLDAGSGKEAPMSRYFDELKRHNVLHVASACATVDGLTTNPVRVL